MTDSMIDEALVLRRAAPLPRYTSYPTANHLVPVAPAEYREWLGALQDGAAL